MQAKNLFVINCRESAIKAWSLCPVSLKLKTFTYVQIKLCELNVADQSNDNHCSLCMQPPIVMN